MRKTTRPITLKRKRLVEDALATVRTTRETIDPALLQSVREAIGQAADGQGKTSEKPVQADRVPVDRKKNLQIIKKFLELKPENRKLHREIMALLAQL